MADEKDTQADNSLQEQEVQYTVEDDTPAPAAAPAPTPAPAAASGERDDDDPDEAELAQYSETVRKRIARMTRAKHDERRARTNAERDREEAIQFARAVAAENEALKQRLTSGEKVLATSIGASVAAELEKAKRELKEAHEAFDADKIVEAQEALQRAVFRAEQARAFQARTAQAPQGQQPAPQQTQPVQPAAPRVDEAAAAWQKRNPWFGSNEEMTALAIGYHNALTKQHGPAYATTNEYYERIDARMREKFPEAFEEQDASPGYRQSPAPTVVAPASRSGPTRRVTLTKRQVELARRLNVPVELYAKKLAEEMERQNNG
jgi:hypothetical protein